jgi:hypothetical protein
MSRYRYENRKAKNGFSKPGFAGNQVKGLFRGSEEIYLWGFIIRYRI